MLLKVRTQDWQEEKVLAEIFNLILKSPPVENL